MGRMVPGRLLGALIGRPARRAPEAQGAPPSFLGHQAAFCWSPVSLRGGCLMPLAVVSLEEAQRLRGRLVLVQLRAEVRSSPDDAVPIFQLDQLGAIVSDFIVGRQEGCAFRLPEER